MDDTLRRLRYEVINFHLAQSRPPTVLELASKTGYEDEVVTQGLQRLAAEHHLKLYDEGVPSLTPISMAHPFSHLPSAHVVTSNGKSWWANCAWCAFGLASMLAPADATVCTLTASGECLRIPVANGQEISDENALQNYVAVFSAPPSQWWKDVRFACSGIQVCTSRDEARGWHEKHGFPAGDIITLEQLWKLSKAWYHDKHTYNYTRKTAEEKDRLFQELGLVSSYWSS